MKWTIRMLSEAWQGFTTPAENLLRCRVSTPLLTAIVLCFTWLAVLLFAVQVQNGNGVLLHTAAGGLSVEVSTDWRGYALTLAIIAGAGLVSAMLDRHERDAAPAHVWRSEIDTFGVIQAEIRLGELEREWAAYTGETTEL